VSIDPGVVSELDTTEVWMIHKPLKITIYNDRIIRDQIFSTKAKEKIATEQEQPIAHDSVQNRGGPTIVVGDYIEGDKYGGDKFSDIKNSTIINKSLVARSLNEIQKKYNNEEVSKALEQIAYFIEKSNNVPAGILFNRFSEEFSKSYREFSVLREIWSGIEKVLPSIKEKSEEVQRIMSVLDHPG
jgi:hypothetical protein